MEGRMDKIIKVTIWDESEEYLRTGKLPYFDVRDFKIVKFVLERCDVPEGYNIKDAILLAIIKTRAEERQLVLEEVNDKFTELSALIYQEMDSLPHEFQNTLHKAVVKFESFLNGGMK
jgi:hypothetical protein